MRTTFEVRQLVRSANGNRLERVYESTFERVAGASYDSFVRDHPSEYFELVRVRHDEECMQHNGKAVR